MSRLAKFNVAALDRRSRQQLGDLVRRTGQFGINKTDLHRSFALAMKHKGFLADVGDRWVVKLPWYEAYRDYERQRAPRPASPAEEEA